MVGLNCFLRLAIIAVVLSLASGSPSSRLMKSSPLKWRPFNLREESGSPLVGEGGSPNLPPFKRWNPHPIPASSHTFDSHGNRGSSSSAFFGGSSSSPLAPYHRGPSIQELAGAAHRPSSSSSSEEDVETEDEEDSYEDLMQQQQPMRPTMDLGDVKIFVDGLKSKIRNEISLLLAVAPEEDESTRDELRSYFGGSSPTYSPSGSGRSHTRKFLPLPLLRGGLTRH